MFFLALIFGAGIIALLVIGFGAFLVSRGYRVLGLGIIALLVGSLLGPGVLDRLRNVSILTELEALNMLPDTLDLTGQRVLFIETGGTICGEICRDVVSIGTEVDAYWVGMGGNIPNNFTDDPVGDVLDGPEHVRPVRLNAPRADDPTGQRFVEPVGTGNAPPYDTVIVYDDSALLHYVAPDLLGAALPDRVNAQFAILVFTDWPDPFAGPPPAPTYRSVVARIAQRPLLPIPFVGVSSVTHPSLSETRTAWMRAICPFAGDAQARDPFTYGYRYEVRAQNGPVN